jgi:hypothetical protein
MWKNNFKKWIKIRKNVPKGKPFKQPYSSMNENV